MIEKLKKLGLSSYEAHTYLTLLKLGSAQATEIAAKAMVPIGRIYGVLSGLEEAHLIRTQNTRPKRYACVEPKSALEILSKNKMEALKQGVMEIETMVDEMASELSGIRTKKQTEKFWTVALGEESLELVRESVSGAQKELLFFIASRMRAERVKLKVMDERYNEIIETLNTAVDRGVEAKVILNKEVDFGSIEDIPAVRELFMHMGCEFNCRVADIPATPFDIIDRENVLLEMQNPVNPGDLFAVINVRDTKLAEELREKFFAIWEKAEEYPMKKSG
ncbi:MAG TPA: helix-turn-helix domain-containing protein [candidate division Zixibacteria bacterium]|nr:helix-turn-helix domain-containing protein [candidate division Zixibacteria bacterium]